CVREPNNFRRGYYLDFW
nr:immunoglobulin heavy chain junction region [Macaca mulatta]MOY21230.1 immunoglobulin heavy chain junction region [Macaca mulatta]MOY22233.1 immunoglobulin heavy chain junction region [Macaca mulatta]MOY22844.1 immunoglobulin heavy chain junction region [Macaca mulatta]MOY24402.1 immunoglobulin heavy chain junction region [Macaca mulatta]